MKISSRKGIGYSPLTDKVYLGRQNREKGIWIGEKEDITNDFLQVSSQFFEKNTVRTINVSNGSKEIFIHCGDSKKEIESVINYLKKLI